MGFHESFPGTIVSQDELPKCDLVCTLGGDGTILRTSHLVGTSQTPVLGINMGRLGFLAAFPPAEAEDALKSALAGTLERATRMRLEVEVPGVFSSELALNDAVVHQGAIARLLELDCSLNDDFISSYRADGLIVATPTGSTAYNLAAGGPILFPGQEAMAITPICAHTLTNRPLVIPVGSKLEIAISDVAPNAVLSLDGQAAIPLEAGSKINITTSDSPLHIYLPNKSYFDILREKLSWGAQAGGSLA